MCYNKLLYSASFVRISLLFYVQVSGVATRGGAIASPPLSPSWHWKSVHFLTLVKHEKLFLDGNFLILKFLHPWMAWPPTRENFFSYATGASAAGISSTGQYSCKTLRRSFLLESWWLDGDKQHTHSWNHDVNWIHLVLLKCHLDSYLKFTHKFILWLTAVVAKDWTVRSWYEPG